MSDHTPMSPPDPDVLDDLNAQLEAARAEVEALRGVLSALSMSVSAGMGDEKTTPDQWFERISWGIDFAMKPLLDMKAAAEARAAQAEHERDALLAERDAYAAKANEHAQVQAAERRASKAEQALADCQRRVAEAEQEIHGWKVAANRHMEEASEYHTDLATLRAEHARLRDAMEVIASPLHIDGEEHRGTMLLARRVMKALPPQTGEPSRDGAQIGEEKS